MEEKYKKLEMYTAIVFSISHINSDHELAAIFEDDQIISDELPYGLRVYTDKELTESYLNKSGYSEGFKKCLLLSKILGCKWAEFDNDGEEYDGIEIYEW